MKPASRSLTDDACYLALKARDARFDGCFYTGVSSTGIYCRPVCSVRAPKRENCRFFEHAAQAEHAGFRPCLRCRPELAPRPPSLNGHAPAAWSTQDASAILAQQAARLLDDPEAWPGSADGAALSMDRLARRLGISDRHLRRIFEAQFGVSPGQYLQTRRLLTAKQLLSDTGLPITQIALISGYASVRRFNAAFLGHYALNPTQLRRHGESRAARGMQIRLGFRPPYDATAMLEFFSRRLLSAVEFTSGSLQPTAYGRTLCVEAAGKSHAGWLLVAFDLPRSQLLLQVSDSLLEVLPLVIRRVKSAFDLDATPQAINAVLDARFPGAGGLRVPGTLDGFELAVRAVLGQQITVAAARTLGQRLVGQFGEPIETPYAELSRLFPRPVVLAQASGDALGQLGIVRQRQAAIVALAQAVHSGRLQLHGSVELQATIQQLRDLPGIGDWTAQYIAMRALRWPDAFPAADVALHKALGVQALKNPSKEAELASAAWRPWRSYAVIRAWSGALAASTLPEQRPDDSSARSDAIKSIAINARLIRAKTLKSLRKSLNSPRGPRRSLQHPAGEPHEI